MAVVVRGLSMRRRFSGVGVGVQVNAPVVMAVDVDVNAVAMEAVEQVSAQQHQHRAHCDLEPAGQGRADGALAHDDRAGES